MVPDVLTKFGLFSLVLAVCAVAVDPVVPETKTTSTISHFVLNETQKTFSNAGNQTDQLTPYSFTSLSEVIDIELFHANESSALVSGTFTLNSPYGIVATGPISVNESIHTITLDTSGPCTGNGLTKLQQSVWLLLNFSAANLHDVNIYGYTSRVYQNAELQIGTPQWVLFGPGMRSAYAINTPATPGQLLQIDIRRRNNSVPAPSKIFHYVLIATEEQCLNQGSPAKPGGSVEKFDISQNPNPDIVSHEFDSDIPQSSTVFIQLVPHDTLSPADASMYNEVYWIQVSFKNPPPPPHSADAGTIFGIICGILIVVGTVGVVYYLYNKKKRQGAEYDRILS